MLEAAFTTLALIYHLTVNNLRKEQRNALAGLIMTVVRSLMMIAGFYLLFALVGVRSSPLRGDFIVYIMSGIFMFQTHNAAIGAVASAGSPTNPMMMHGPINTAVMIAASALATLYRQTISAIVILSFYHYVIQPIHLESALMCYAMLILAWMSGCCIGLIFLAFRPWWPQGAQVLSSFYQRMNMIFSGKMFVANAMPAALLPTFAWNPLFHIIDQTRGFAFINYSPRNSSLIYPVYCILGLWMVGLMAEFVSRKSISVSMMRGR
ncbi:ABC transporter permease [Paracoccus litorisediminis]|uniref:ABC transporter permease n=1 Tax=Paracoccus litorisediminis TaxID=2006130 RepID=UPI00372DDED5